MPISSSESDIKSRLSLAYLTAVAAAAGCQLQEWIVDRNGVDATVVPIQGKNVKVDIQVKATSSNPMIAGGQSISHQLDVKTYNKLRDPFSVSPQLLVVYVLPSDPLLWLDVSGNRTKLKNLGYWINLRNAAAVSTKTVAVNIPTAQIFDSHALVDIMKKIRAAAEQGKIGP
jgi:hypothetical protein